MTKSRTVLIIGKVWPEPNSSAAGTRMIQLIDMLQAEDYNIKFVSTASHTDFEEDLTPKNVPYQSIKLNDSSFDSFIGELQPSIVIFDRYMTEEQFGWRVRENSATTVQVIDTEDLHFLRHARQEALKKNKSVDLYNDIAKRELASILRADVSLIISEFEMDLLQSKFNIPTSKLIYLPLLFDDAQPSKVPFEKRKDLVFIGNFYHEPNWDAVLQLKKHWGHIRTILPGVKINIYGAYPSQKVNDLHNEQDGFLIRGRAESAKEVIENARLLIAPLRFGAGLKGKLLEAMLFGTPSVTTAVGSEGISEDIWNGLICNDFDTIGQELRSIYENKSVFQSTQNKGYTIIKERFIRSNFEKKWIQKIASIQVDLIKHRQENFLGEILHHHTLQSTRYLAKWIEEKEK